MSLLNQVLQDLDERAVPPVQRPRHVGHQAPSRPAAEAPVDRSGFDLWRWSAWTLLGMLSIGAGWLYLQPADEPSLKAAAPPSTLVQPAVAEDPGSPAAVEAVSAEAVVEDREAVNAGAKVSESFAGEARIGAVADQSETVMADPPSSSDPVEAFTHDTVKADAEVLDDRPVAYLPLTNDAPPSEADAPRSVSAKVKAERGDDLSLNGQARRQIEDGELSAAEQTVLRRLADRPGDLEARELLVGLLLRGGRYAQALDAVDAGLLHHPRHQKFLLIQARLLAQSGDSAAAVTVLNEQVRQGQDSREVLQMLGALHQQQGRYDEAVAVYRRLVARAPDAGPAWVGLAIGLDALGNAGALEAYTRALSLGDLPEAAARYARQRRSVLGSGNG